MKYNINFNNYPFLILIFSILIIYAIIQYKNNKKLNYKIESFMNNNYINVQENNLKLNAENNLTFKEYVNGNWTYNETTVNPNSTANNLIKININDKNDNNDNNGTVILTKNNITMNIIFILNNFIVASNEQKTFYIKFINIFKNNSNDENNELILNQPTAIMEYFNNNILISKFYSYKINNINNIIPTNIIGIIQARSYIINNPPPWFDYNSYQTIIGNYPFPSNLINITFNTGPVDNNIFSILKNTYDGKMKFSIRAVFNSPSSQDKEIITKNSNPELLSVIKDNNIPYSIDIQPLKNSNINNNFSLKAIILYFYKYDNCNEKSYNFSGSINNISKDSLQLNNNNKATNMFNNNIQFYDPTTIERTMNCNYKMITANRVNSNLNSTTKILFSSFSDKL